MKDWTLFSLNTSNKITKFSCIKLSIFQMVKYFYLVGQKMSNARKLTIQFMN